jgi:DNA-binding MarR family transcriptional regulator
VNDDARRVWQGLRALVHERYDRRKEVSDALGMSFIRAKALRHLAAAGPMSMRRLAQALSTDAPYTTLVIEDLVGRGLVSRTENPADRRARIVGLTPAGAHAAAEAEAILSAPPEPLLGLSAADLATLDRIVTTLLEDPPAAGLPHLPLAPAPGEHPGAGTYIRTAW